MTVVALPAPPRVRPRRPSSAGLLRAARPGPVLRRLLTLAMLGIGVIAAVGVLVGMMRASRQAPWHLVLSAPGACAAMLAATVGGYLCQSAALTLLLPGRLPRHTRLLLPWAAAAMNRVTPAAAGGVLLSSQVLRRRGISCGGAALVVGSTAGLHGLAGMLLAAAAVAAGGSGSLRPPGVPGGMLVWLLPLLGVGVAAFLAGHPASRARAKDVVRQARGEVAVRRLPLALACQVGSRFAPCVVLYAALAGTGHRLSMTTVVLLVLVAGMAGSAVPVPGNGGGVELAMAGMLAMHGVPLAAASATVLIARLVGFWLPGVCGVGALLPMRRDLRAAARAGARTAELAVLSHLPHPSVRLAAGGPIAEPPRAA